MGITFEDIRTGKIKLEFGNLEQLRVIRAYEKSLEFKDTACPECDGEGVITCPCCDGDGKRPKGDKK